MGLVFAGCMFLGLGIGFLAFLQKGQKRAFHAFLQIRIGEQLDQKSGFLQVPLFLVMAILRLKFGEW